MRSFSPTRITDENVVDIMGTAAYGGITYWAVEPTPEDFDAAPPGDDVHTIKDGEDGKVYYLTPGDIRAAVVRIAVNEPRVVNETIAGYVRAAFDDWTEEDGIDCGDIDADAADAIVQFACFTEIIYG